jgi:transcriptional regulator with XRE-family HTH domain
MEFNDRIREAMESAKLGKTDLARATGKTSAAITQWIDGSTKSLKADTAQAIQVATGYSAMWLVTGRGEKLVTSMPDMSSTDTMYGKRLAAALEHSKKSRRELAQAIGRTPQNIGMIINDAKRTDQKLTSDANAQAACFLRVNAHWLATGQGEMASDVPVAGYEMSVQAIDLAELFDMIPVSDKLRRARAYSNATCAILDAIQNTDSA